MFGKFTRTRQRIDRSRRIAEILIKYGFGFAVAELGLAGPGWLRPGAVASEVPKLTIYERLRILLEELGPTFVKLGQTLSTRTDILPPALAFELDKLQDNVPPFPFAVVRSVIEADLAGTLEELFTEFHPEPLAAASVGQVHRAVLPDGTQVVVKVQRPGVDKEMEADLLIMRDLAGLAERRTEWGKMYALEQLVEEFGAQLHQQLDYTVEGHHADHFREVSADVEGMYVPTVFWDYSGRRLLTMEYVDGIKISDLPIIDEANIDRKALATRLVEIMATQALDKGLYHADPHPGNLMVQLDGTIVFMDFGMVGYVDEHLKDQLVDLVLAVVDRDVDRIVSTLLSVGIVERRVDTARLKLDIRNLLRKYYEMPLAAISFTEAMNEMFGLAVKHRVRLPPDLTLLMKTALTIEGIATQLDPDMSIVDVARPFAKQIREQRLSARAVWKELSHEVMDTRRLLKGLPGRLEGLLTRLESGEMTIRWEMIRLGEYIRQMGVIINRLTAGIVVAAMFVFSALALRIPGGPTWLGMPGLAVVGLVLSTILGLWLFMAILRSGAL
jgi:ubiquinone biosynthesis protein